MHTRVAVFDHALDGCVPPCGRRLARPFSVSRDHVADAREWSDSRVREGRIQSRGQQPRDSRVRVWLAHVRVWRPEGRIHIQAISEDLGVAPKQRAISRGLHPYFEGPRRP